MSMRRSSLSWRRRRPTRKIQGVHKDVVVLGTDIARARGLDAANADIAGRISLGIFFAETNGLQNIRNARSNKYEGSLQTGVAEDQNGQRRWVAIKERVAAFDP